MFICKANLFSILSIFFFLTFIWIVVKSEKPASKNVFMYRLLKTVQRFAIYSIEDIIWNRSCHCKHIQIQTISLQLSIEKWKKKEIRKQFWLFNQLFYFLNVSKRWRNYFSFSVSAYVWLMNVQILMNVLFVEQKKKTFWRRETGRSIKTKSIGFVYG